VFPSLLTRDRPMSENTINAALRRLGYDGNEQTGHGFRSMASTLLNEQGFPPDVIELQLAHAERNKVRAAYNKAQRLGERRIMMQAWSDYLVRLKEGAVS
jgi:integrase